MSVWRVASPNFRTYHKRSENSQKLGHFFFRSVPVGPSEWTYAPTMASSRLVFSVIAVVMLCAHIANAQFDCDGQFCPTGQCCGANGLCGSTIDYCGAGCNLEWGVCYGTSYFLVGEAEAVEESVNSDDQFSAPHFCYLNEKVPA